MIVNRQYQTETTGNQAHIKLNFGSISFAIVLFTILLSCEYSLYAQVRVTGHVFAEIVEPSALSVKAINCHFIDTTGNTPNNELILAEVKLSSGPNMNIDVAVVTSNLVAANGEILPFDAFACHGFTEENSFHITDEKLFTLKASPGTSIRQNTNTTFNGHYSVVFMYN